MKKLNEMGSTVNGATSKRDEYIAFSIIVNFKIMQNYSLVSHAPFPPVVYFSGFHVLCFKYWLLYASYSQIIIRISFSMRHVDIASKFGMGNFSQTHKIEIRKNLNYGIVVKR